MNYQELTNLQAGQRIKVWHQSEYQKATFMGHIRGADPAAWIAFDNQQVEGRGQIATKIYTGLQFEEVYWDEREKNRQRKFLLLTDEELNEELIGSMEVVG